MSILLKIFKPTDRASAETFNDNNKTIQDNLNSQDTRITQAETDIGQLKNNKVDKSLFTPSKILDFNNPTEIIHVYVSTATNRPPNIGDGIVLTMYYVDTSIIFQFVFGVTGTATRYRQNSGIWTNWIEKL